MTVRPSPIREALRCPMQHLIVRDDCRWCRDLREALAELDALEAVAGAAREVCITYHPRSGAKNPIEELRAALARLVAVQDGQTEGDHRAEHYPGKTAPAAPSVCPCKSHGDPDGDCGEDCA